MKTFIYNLKYCLHSHTDVGSTKSDGYLTSLGDSFWTIEHEQKPTK